MWRSTSWTLLGNSRTNVETKFIHKGNWPLYIGRSHTNECPSSAAMDRLPDGLSACRRSGHHNDGEWQTHIHNNVDINEAPTQVTVNGLGIVPSLKKKGFSLTSKDHVALMFQPYCVFLCRWILSQFAQACASWSQRGGEKGSRCKTESITYQG